MLVLAGLFFLISFVSASGLIVSVSDTTGAKGATAVVPINIEVFALPEGSMVVFKYPPVEVSAGDKFSMKLDADDPGTPLDTPSGPVSPTEIPIKSI